MNIQEITDGIEEKRARFSSLGWIGVFIAVGITAVLLIWHVPGWVISSGGMNTSDYLTASHHLRISVVIIVGAAGLMTALFILWRISQILKDNFSVLQESNLIMQFGQAVEHLGTYKLEVQLGGIFTLERIAKQSQNSHWTVMEVLTAYLRENAPWQENQGASNGNSPMAGEAGKVTKTASTVQAIMTVIGRRNWIDAEINNGKFLNLRRTNLSHLDLRGADLRRANLRGVNLAGTNLMDANLTGAFLGEANLSDANLVRANLQSAHLTGANLQNANMREVNVEEANLTGTNLKGAFLNDTNLESAHFSSPGIEEGEHEHMSIIS